MGKYKLTTLPKSTVCEFAPGKYIWQVRRLHFPMCDGEVSSDTFMLVTEIFELTENSEVNVICSGRLLNSYLDTDGCFYIIDENNTVPEFKQEYEMLTSAPTTIQAKLLMREKKIIARKKEEEKSKFK